MGTSASTGTVVAGVATAGVVVPYDFALDRELWRWAPRGLDLLLTRTPRELLPVSVEQARAVSAAPVVARCVQAVLEPGPAVVAYACTSGSFVDGLEGERALVEAMLHAGAPAAATTSGALVEALRHLGARRVAVATPYDESVTFRLEAFLAEAGIEVSGTASLGRTGAIWQVGPEETAPLVRAAATTPCDAVFVSCTNLRTYDLIAPLERELGVPVLTANQVTMWAAAMLSGLRARGPGQRLLDGRRGRRRVTLSGIGHVPMTPGEALGGPGMVGHA